MLIVYACPYKAASYQAGGMPDCTYDIALLLAHWPDEQACRYHSAITFMILAVYSHCWICMLLESVSRHYQAVISRYKNVLKHVCREVCVSDLHFSSLWGWVCLQEAEGAVNQVSPQVAQLLTSPLQHKVHTCTFSVPDIRPTDC